MLFLNQDKNLMALLTILYRVARRFTHSVSCLRLMNCKVYVATYA